MRGKQVDLVKDCNVLMVPAGTPVLLPQGTRVVITQALGDTCSIVAGGQLFRIDGDDLAALGDDFEVKKPEVPANAALEDVVWAWLKTIYDPEIPVCIVDLGLIYNVVVVGAKVKIIMTLTSPTCGMGPILQEEVLTKINNIDEVESVDVQVVFDPPWQQDMMSDAAKLELGLL
jgi:probable FeS assembly SUF system protein SufT